MTTNTTAQDCARPSRGWIVTTAQRHLSRAVPDGTCNQMLTCAVLVTGHLASQRTGQFSLFKHRFQSRIVTPNLTSQTNIIHVRRTQPSPSHCPCVYTSCTFPWRAPTGCSRPSAAPAGQAKRAARRQEQRNAEQSRHMCVRAPTCAETLPSRCTCATASRSSTTFHSPSLATITKLSVDSIGCKPQPKRVSNTRHAVSNKVHSECERPADHTMERTEGLLMQGGLARSPSDRVTSSPLTRLPNFSSDV